MGRCFAALALVLAGALPAWAAEPLVACLDRRAIPAEAEAASFDLAVTRALAGRLGRAVSVQWYSSSLDGDADPAAQLAALLADGRCQIAPGQPLFADALELPATRKSRLPDFDGAKPADRRRSVALDDLAASRGYRFDPFVVAVSANAAHRPITSLADLRGLKLVSEEGTLADAILMSYAGGALIGGITHLIPGGSPLDALARGEADATLTELHRLDAFIAGHPGTPVAYSGHAHSIGFNVGVIGLARDAALMAAIDAAIGAMLAGHEMPDLAAGHHAAWLPPHAAHLGAAIRPAELRGD